VRIVILRRVGLACLVAALAVGCAAPPPRTVTPAERDVLRAEVAATERAFAKSMADRDHGEFTAFLSEEAVFFSGPTPLRGKAAVAAGWKRFFERKDAPFSWEPEKVEVLDSGTLALSSGPVRDRAGKLVGTFTSVWRLEAPGTWRIVLDKGDDACECRQP
jgi:ketosteroid isomerase-like protein